MLNRESLNLEVVAAAGNEDKILVHDERNRVLAQLLAAMGGEGFPIAVGVLFSDSKSTFTEDTSAHLESVRKIGAALEDLLHSGHTWTVE